MEALNWTYAIVGALAVVLALASRKMRELPLSEPLFALAAGAVVGPYALGLVSVPDDLRDLALLEGSRLIVALSVMEAALRFPATQLRTIARAVVLLLVVVMPVAVLISGAASLLVGLPLGLALLVGAILAPTDPVLAGAVVSGEPAERDLPSRVRHILSAESGINDGLALPFVALAITVLVPAASFADRLGLLAYEILGGVLVGGLLGGLAAWGTRFATQHHDLEKAPGLLVTVLLAVATLGIGRAVGTDGFVAVFVAGTAYNLLTTQEDRSEQEDTDEAVNRYLCLPLFFLLGIVLPWREWGELGLAAVAVVLIVLLGRRLPLALLLARPMRLDVRQAAFVGWFGPIGAGSIFYLAHSLDTGATDPRLFAVVTLIIAASIVAFGLTGSPGRNLYARSAGAGEVEDDDGGGAGGAEPARSTAG